MLALVLLQLSACASFSIYGPPPSTSGRVGSPVLSAAEPPIVLSRRAALVSAAVLASGGSAAEAATLAGTVTELDKSIPKQERNTKGAPEKHTPAIATKPKGIDLVEVEFTVPHVMDAEKPHYIQYMWLKEYTPKATPGFVNLLAYKAFKPADSSPPAVSKLIRKGTTVVPLLYCNLHGLWEGKEYTV